MLRFKMVIFETKKSLRRFNTENRFEKLIPKADIVFVMRRLYSVGLSLTVWVEKLDE